MTPEPYRNGKIKSHEIVRVQNVIVVYILVISIKPKVAKGNCYPLFVPPLIQTTFLYQE
ncbi:predicted protein [Sclerotinia sclerotiorum 1980 UF-70]|uniref:Uncharacterized protein n=1 Tax=Sclerotinia sclerotiorum (strain ATCC 18683 / 1980 / Ss-1) TaxID=665079 RepID=A7EMJ2_SCLS1|nr:predicted protein [Sclerotinia sclerotiorum 1980 UF-70]EDO04058.1 predicted protein [Sclerotinia sclerotiorum 1980 UF-70]